MFATLNECRQTNHSNFRIIDSQWRTLFCIDHDHVKCRAKVFSMTSYRVYITEQTTAKCYLFVLYSKSVKKFAKISFVVRRKDFSTPFDVIMIYTKQSTPLAVDDSKIAVIGLSLKWRQRASVL